MTDLFDSNGSGTPVGGLAAFRALSNRNEFQSTNNQDTVWGELWKARGPWPFRIKTNEEANVVFLTDAQVFPAYELLTGWVNTNGRNFPKRDFIRAPGWVINAAGEVTPPSGPCPIQTITGLNPRIISVSVILDTQKYTNKEGVVVPYTVRQLIVKSDSVNDTLAVASEAAGRDLQYSRFRVKRSNDNRSPNVGDSWFPLGYIDPEGLDAKVDKWRDQLAGIDLATGYRALTADEIKSVINHHCRVAKKHSNPEVAITQFDEAALEAYNSGVVTTATTTTTAKEAANPSDTVFDDIDTDEVLDLGVDTSADAGGLDDIL